MFSAKNRLQKDKDIEKVFKKGRSAYVGDLGLRFAPNGLSAPRFTIMVSTKVSKKAVLRNLLKRRLREIIRKDILPQTKISFDGVLITKKPLLDLDYSELRKLTLKVFTKAKLL